jgi:hypothetical protein
MQSLHSSPTTRLNVPRWLHYHKIVENEFYVSMPHYGIP